MSTPTPGKSGLPQQGKTPSQQPPHGAGATPQVSTPFSTAQAAFSPHGPRSSPQQLKKSPASMTAAAMGRSSVPVNFDSPSVDAAVGALDLGVGLDLGIPTIGNLVRASDDERARRLDAVISILNRSPGLVSEAGLERLAQKLELEFLWENSMDSNDKRTLIVAGAALELVVEFSHDIVQSVALSFPDSAEIVNKHADAAGEILSRDLRLSEGQSPLTKSLAGFAANFERLAMLDKLSVNPGLNLYEGVAGIYESLSRLHAWELQKTRQDPNFAGRPDYHLENIVLCTKSGRPSMNARGRVGMTLDYWKDKRLGLVPPDMAAWVEEHDKSWTILIGCTPLTEIGVSPVRISDKWIGANIEKIALPDEMHAGAAPLIDWLEPESTFVPLPDPAKADPMQSAAALLGPRLPDVVFHASFEPPVHIPLNLWQQIQDLGCTLRCTEAQQQNGPDSFDALVIPFGPSEFSELEETRTVTRSRTIAYPSPDDPTKLVPKRHANTLTVPKAIMGRSLTAMTFSHPQQLVTVLPFLRQYIFLAQLLEHSFVGELDPAIAEQQEEANSNNNNNPDADAAANGSKSSSIRTTTTNQDDFRAFMSNSGAATTTTTNGHNGHNLHRKQPPPDPEPDHDLDIDINLTMQPAPRLQIIFPFRRGDDQPPANVTLEIQGNGRVAVVEQNVLDERNMTAPNGRQRKVEDVGGLLERLEDVGKWAQFMRDRWA